MDRRIYHGNITPSDFAHALLAEFNRGNLHAQAMGTKENLAVQIATHRGSRSGGHTALTIRIQAVEDGVMVEIGQQEWLGVAASIGQTAFSALRNPINLLHRLDDIAQDLENMQLVEKVWKVIGRTVTGLGASYQLSERLSRITCGYCGTSNQLGEGNCCACGAPMGAEHPTTCSRCGFAVSPEEKTCPNCNQSLI
jgi:hypothetical protein